MSPRRTACIAVMLGGLFPLSSHAQDPRNVIEPAPRPVCAVLTAQSMAADSKQDDTVRIQHAVNTCPPGRALRLAMGNGRHEFVAGPLTLKSGVTLTIDAGVTLYASTNPHSYALGGKGVCGSNDLSGKGCRPFISADNTEGSGIMGEGVIDGQGGHRIDGKPESWWQIARRAQKEGTRQNVPRLIEINRSRDFTLHGITLRNSANFHVVLDRVDGFTAWGVKIDSPADARNTDGIDPVSSRNITIAHSFIRTGDDNVAIKAGSHGAAENISIRHNHFYNGHGMSIGSETEGGVRNVLVEDLTIDGATSGLRIKSDMSRGGLVRDVAYRQVCMQNVRAPLDFDTHYDPNANGGRIPVYEGISLEHVRSLTPGRVMLRGFDEAHPLVARMDNVIINGGPSLVAANARIRVGPGGMQPLPSGDNVVVTDGRAPAGSEICAEASATRFVPFPETAPIDVSRSRPQLTARAAGNYAYAEVLKVTGVAGRETTDPWDPLNDPLATGATFKPDYIVDHAAAEDGRKTFKTVQAAISRAALDSAAASAPRRVFVLVKPGIYRELVYVPAMTSPLTLYGSEADAGRTRITANLDALVEGKIYRSQFGRQFDGVASGIAAMYDSLKNRPAVGTPGSAVAWIRNDGFQARNLTFANTFNKTHGDAFTESGAAAVHSQAVAMMVDDADKVQFENVRFESYQDTLYLKSSAPARTIRTFINKSYVEGDMDFIFGEGTAYFNDTEIRSLGDRRMSYVTAPSTQLLSKFGFVFNACRFTHDGTPNALAGNFKLVRQWFRGQRCTPFGAMTEPAGYACRVAEADAYEAPTGTISRGVLETVGKVVILNSQIGVHIDRARPWADWNAPGTIKYRPVQYSSDDFWDNLVAAGIDPVRQLGYSAKKKPVEPFLAEFNNTDE